MDDLPPAVRRFGFNPFAAFTPWNWNGFNNWGGNGFGFGGDEWSEPTEFTGESFNGGFNPNFNGGFNGGFGPFPGQFNPNFNGFNPNFNQAA